MKLAWLLVVLTSVISVSWYFFTNNPLTITGPANAASGGHQFQVWPPAMGNAVQGQSRTPNRLFFLNFDDGRCTFTDFSGSAQTFVYPYRSVGYSQPYAESTEVYTDKKPPQSVARLEDGLTAFTDPHSAWNIANSMTVSAGQVSTIDPYRLQGMTKPIQIEANRRIAVESGVTYVVTVENNRKHTGMGCDSLQAEVAVSYDSDVLEFLSVRDGFRQLTQHAANGNPVLSGGRGTVTLGLGQMLDGEQRSLMFIFKTKASVTTSTPVDSLVTAKLTFSKPGAPNVNPACIQTYRDTMHTHNQVFFSHDPNSKIIVPATICIDDDQYLKFRVDFQNDGLGPTEKIVIEDELDPLFPTNIRATAIKDVTAVIGGQRHTAVVLNNFADRKFRFTLNNAVLNGTHQIGYRTKFSDASTRGYLEFRIHTDQLSSRPPCSAICNSAQIFFDCNPPIQTNTAMTTINCNNCSACGEREIRLNEPIITSPTEEQIVLPFTGQGANARSFIIQQLGTLPGNIVYKWYPASKVSSPGNLNAMLIQKDRTAFTLVASTASDGTGTSCRRVIIKLLYEPACDLSVTATATPESTGGCPDFHTYTINAQVSGTGDLHNLNWSMGADCQTGGVSYTKTGVKPGQYAVVVTNPVNGCTAETIVDVSPHPIVVDDNPTDCMADLTVTGGTPPYQYKWQWDGAFQQHTGSVLNDLNGKKIVTVTVTDANGCKKIFQVKSGCPTVQSTNTGLIVVLTVVGAAGVGVLLNRRRKNKKDV